jgi:hypothetical protein
MVLQLWEGKLLLPEVVDPPRPVANHSDCCCGEHSCGPDFCTFASIPTPWTADLGAGGWTNDNCNQCVNVGGQYTLDVNEAHDPLDNCTWEYVAEDYCTVAPYDNARLLVHLDHRIAGDLTNWFWWLLVSLSSGGVIVSSATYESATTAEEEGFDDCWFLGGNGVGDKITMNKTSESHFYVCAGALPDPVQVWVP